MTLAAGDTGVAGSSASELVGSSLSPSCLLSWGPAHPCQGQGELEEDFSLGEEEGLKRSP